MSGGRPETGRPGKPRRARVQTSREQDKHIFSTARYHSLPPPRLYNDVAGTQPAFGGNAQLMKLAKGNYYDGFSLCDTYRAQLPPLALLRPGLSNALVRSLPLKGWLPIFRAGTATPPRKAVDLFLN